MEKLLHSSWIWQIAKGTSIAYLHADGMLELRPYLNTSLRAKIWGIEVGGVIFKLTHEPDTDWETAQKVEVNRKGEKLPHTSDFDIGFTAKEAFNETVEILNGCDIKADKWRDGWYWTSENAGEHGVVIDMANGKTETVAKNMRNGYVRLCSHKFRYPKMLSLGFSLVYLIDGVFKNSDKLETLKSYKPWGLHITHNFLALTEEKQEISWYEATKRSQTMSTQQMEIGLPEKEDIDFINKYRSSINAALIILQGYGVKTDLLNFKEPYLTNDEWDKDHIIHNFRRIHKSEPHLCRYIGHNKKGLIII